MKAVAAAQHKMVVIFNKYFISIILWGAKIMQTERKAKQIQFFYSISSASAEENGFLFQVVLW